MMIKSAQQGYKLYGNAFSSMATLSSMEILQKLLLFLGILTLQKILIFLTYLHILIIKLHVEVN